MGSYALELLSGPHYSGSPVRVQCVCCVVDAKSRQDLRAGQDRAGRYITSGAIGTA